MAMKPVLKKTESLRLNVHSYIRVRPLGPKEKKAASLDFRSKEVIIKSVPESSKLNKTLTFDRVFDSDASQLIVYHNVVKPMIKEVLSGYNCTVFAYGQTGTGKTFTMTGLPDVQTPETQNVHVGIIPRAMEDIFFELAEQPCEYHVTVSYMELYNEKLSSLLSDETNIQLIDDFDGGVHFKGLTPTPVKTKDDAFKLLQLGAERRQTASTLLNSQSSRSHAIFTINVNIKENILGSKDDVLRIGKLHLVDLAGSENVSKSGASDVQHKTREGINRRLTEASNINKSLLTLGRVITSLTENSTHIPYRESKLTRLLRDSLGGRTKTSIIGTISPALVNLEETESTLNYAYKARSIKNKPEKNQRISKKEFMTVATEEIQKLKRDLEAVRQGEGFYISQKTHTEMVESMKGLDAQVKDWYERYNQVKSSFEETKELFSNLSSEYDDKCAEYDELERMFSSESLKFKEKLDIMENEIKLREFLLSQYEESESLLTNQANTCRSVLESLLDQSARLHDKIERKTDIEFTNEKILNEFKTSVSNKFIELKNIMGQFLSKEKDFINGFSGFTGNLFDKVQEENQAIILEIARFETKIDETLAKTAATQEELVNDVVGYTEDLSIYLHEETSAELNILSEASKTIFKPCIKALKQKVLMANKSIKIARDSLKKHNEQFYAMKDELSNQQFEVEKVINDITYGVESAILSMKTASSLSAELNTNTALAALKTAHIAELIKEVGELLTTTKMTSQMAQDECDNAISIIDDLRDTTTAELLEFHRKKAKTYEKCELQHKKMQAMGEANLKKVEKAVMGNIKPVRKAEKELSKSSNKLVQRLKSRETTECEKLNTISKYTSICGEDLANKSAEMKKQKTDMKHEIDVISTLATESLESCLRQENTLIQKKIADIEDQDETMEKNMNSMIDYVEETSYQKDISLGVTPRRVSKNEVHYPKSFHATAPRHVLTSKYRESRKSPSSTKYYEDYVQQQKQSHVPDEDKENVDTITPKKSKGYNTKEIAKPQLDDSTIKKPLSIKNSNVC